MVVFISTSYFSIREIGKVKVLKKYWWKNTIIQILKYRDFTFIIATIGHGKANAAMTATYLVEKYRNIKFVINIDLALSTNEKIKTADATISTKFIYRDVDQTVFEDMKYGQVINETETFQFDSELARKIQNLKLGLLESVIGTGDMLIYNTEQFKELIEKYGNSIDVIDEEAGALAQVFKKTDVKFISIKVIYNNAISPWDSDPKHRYKMYEITNTFKYLVKRILNFLSSSFEYVLLKSSQTTLDVLFSIMEKTHDEWIYNIKSDTSKVLSVSPNSFMLLDKAEKDPWQVDVIRIKTNANIKNEKGTDIEAAKIILGVDEWRYAPSHWVSKLPFVDQVSMNDEELLWNKSSSYNHSTTKEYKIQSLVEEMANIINKYSENNETLTYNTKPVNKKAMVLYCDANISFYITQNDTHDLIEENKFGSSLLRNEFIKHLNIAFAEIVAKFHKIHIYVNVNILFNNTIQLFIKSENSIGKKVNFGKVNVSMQNDYTVVDNMSDDKDVNKVGSFKTAIKLKPVEE